jgi:phospholipid/cholesterol/gamma-HCH transport system permease protein
VASLAREAISASERLGATVLGLASEIGGIVILAFSVLRRLIPPRIDRVELFKSLHKMGVESVVIVSATAAFVGAIMVVQAAPLVVRFGAKDLVGWAAGFATLREVGPLLIALMFNGRVGANNAAELGTMTVTSQVDALRALAIDPIGHLVVPRVIAMVLMMVVLTIIGDGVALLGAMGAAKVLLDVDPRTFLGSFTALLDEWDFLAGVIKSAVFGLMIAITSCHYGLNVSGGAPGVGRSVNSAVVAAASGIFILDYFTTFFLGD